MLKDTGHVEELYSRCSSNGDLRVNEHCLVDKLEAKIHSKSFVKVTKCGSGLIRGCISVTKSGCLYKYRRTNDFFGVAYGFADSCNSW